MTQSRREMPIFPLSTVLFPGGILPLRIFETRYMDMVRTCLKEETGFGVCLITSGQETGSPAEHERIGCSTRITRWDMEQLGVLNIRTIGEHRFQILDSRTQADGLIIATTELIQPEPDTPVDPQFSPCVDLLRKIISDLIEKEPDPMRQMIDQPYQFESTSWVSCRLCEFLPIAAPTKHKLMALDDPQGRLSVVMDYLVKQEVI